MDADRVFENESRDERSVREGQPESGSKATDLFATVKVEPVAASAWETVADGSSSTSFRPEAAPAVVAPVAAPIAVASPSVASVSKPAAIPIQNGGFTQLLRALNYEQVKPDAGKTSAPRGNAAPAGPPPPSAEPGQAFAPAEENVVMQAIRAMEATRPVTVAPVTPAPVLHSSGVGSSSSQVTSFGVPTPVQPVATTTPVAGSFTQMFQALEGEVVNPAGAATAESIVETPKSEAAPNVAAPGSFTQMFRALDADVVATPQHLVAVEPPAAAVPGSFTQMFSASVAAVPQVKPAEVEPESITQVFRTLDATPPAHQTGVADSFEQQASVASPSTAEPGSFTQIFRTLDADPTIPPEVRAPVAGVEPPPAAPGSFTQMFQTLDAVPEVLAAPVQRASAPGSFTQMFETLDSQPVSVPTPPAPNQVPASAVSARGSAGTFTQIFRTLDAEKPETPRAQGAPGSFTQMFGAPTQEPPRSSADSLPTAGASGASQVFATYRPATEPARAAEPYAPAPYAPAVQPPPSNPTAGGGLTQLLRTLDSPASSNRQYDSPMAAPAPQQSQQPGSFTAVYGKLDPGLGAPPVTASPAPVATPNAPPLAGRDATQAFRAPDMATPATAPQVSAGPSEFTRILNASQFRESALRGEAAAGVSAAPAAAPAGAGSGSPGMSMPALPHVPVVPNAPAVPHWGAAASSAPVAPAMPHVPVVPQAKLPEAPKPAAGTMQQYLPLLLIVIIFLLLALLVAVFFLMKK